MYKVTVTTNEGIQIFDDVVKFQYSNEHNRVIITQEIYGDTYVSENIDNVISIVSEV